MIDLNDITYMAVKDICSCYKAECCSRNYCYCYVWLGTYKAVKQIYDILKEGN